MSPAPAHLSLAPQEVYDVLMADAQKPKPKLQWSTFEHMV
jgi:hypothetical protein